MTSFKSTFAEGEVKMVSFSKNVLFSTKIDNISKTVTAGKYKKNINPVDSSNNGVLRFQVNLITNKDPVGFT